MERLEREEREGVSEEAIKGGLAFPQKTWREWFFGPKDSAKKGIKKGVRI